jgi:hypothetical protein
VVPSKAIISSTKSSPGSFTLSRGWGQRVVFRGCDRTEEADCYKRKVRRHDTKSTAKLHIDRLRAGAGPGLCPQCGLRLLLHSPKAQARAGLVFGLSPQAGPQARPPGQARKSPSPQYKAWARPKPALFRPAPALDRLKASLHKTCVTRPICT